MAAPTLVVVSGPPASGKTSLAHALATAVGCPAICRDEIKEGMVHGDPGYVPALGDDVALRVYDTFFATLRVLLSAGVTTVAEAAFQDRLWRRGLEPLLPLARVKVVQCYVGDEVARERVAARRRAAHADGQWDVREFERVSLGGPALPVDTTDGYQPALADIVRFVG